MPSLLQIPNFKLKVAFLTHFIFISLSAMGHWMGPAYLFYNFILIWMVVWSIYQPQNEEPLQMAIVVNGVSILLDILLLVMSYPNDSYFAREKFSAAMCILHLISRPFSVLLLMKSLEERTGMSTGLFNQPNSQTYEDIDRNLPQNTHGGSYDFSNAQQI